MTRGALIVIEGLDRAGKSTQHGLLCDVLESQGHCVQHIRFPDRTTPIGASISSYLKGSSNLEDHAIHLLFSANRWEAASSINQAIQDGTTVVIDRYYYSGIVYTAAKSKPNLGPQWCKAPDVGLPRPDLVIFLDLDIETAKSRGGFGDERYEREDLQRTVRKLFYDTIEQEEKDKNITCVVDASRSLEEVASDVHKIAKDLFTSCKLETPLETIEP